MSNDDPLLTSALRGMAEEDQRLGVSAEVAARVSAEFQAASAARRKARARRSTMMLAAAAALVAAVAVPWRLSRRAGSTDANGTAGQAQSNLSAREIVTEFMPLAYSDVPITSGQIVRLQVPRAALASFGLTPQDSAAAIPSTDTVLADVIVGDDGLARAVRFVRSSP